MKKVILGLISLGLLASCTDGNHTNNEPFERNCVLHARIESTNTRMTVDADNQLHWGELDGIGVYGVETKNVKFSYAGTQSGITEFTGNPDANQEEFAFAYYPYQSEAVKDGNSLTVGLPSEYLYKDSSNAPLSSVYRFSSVMETASAYDTPV